MKTKRKNVMKTKRKNVWNVVISSFVGVAILLFTFIPVRGVIRELSDLLASQHVEASGDNGGMGGYIINHLASNIMFFFTMTIYLSTIVALSFIICCSLSENKK